MNRFLRRFLIIVAACLCLSAGSATLSLAQKPVLTQSVDEPGRTPYTSHFFINTNFAPIALGSFQPVPAGYRLVVTYASVTLTATRPASFPLTLLLGDSFTASSFSYDNGIELPSFTVVPGSSASTFSYAYASRGQVAYYFSPGVTPQMVATGFNPQDDAFFRGTLVGYLVPLSAAE